MGKKITEKVTWVGKIDWELNEFHGHEYSTEKGSSYNSYLIRDKKTILMDTVWKPFDDEFVANLKKEIDLKDIDYIVMNHNENDHSGALPALMREIPDTPIYCTKKGEAILRGLYHQDWNFVNVKTGDTLDLGDSQLVFIEAAMLHWPDTMFTYMTGENILFSNDGFGQHYASERMYNDCVDQAELYQEAMKYYANILNLYSPMVTRKIDEILKMGVPVNMICPSHGVIWRKDPLKIVAKYQDWAKAYQENQITIIYDTMWNSTRRMAECIAEGLRETDPTLTVKLFNSAVDDKNDIVTEVFKSKAAERAAAEAAAKKIAGAFGKGTQMGNKGTGTTGSGLEGSPTGNSSEGKSGGVGGYGTFDLNGRSLGSGGLPMPVYNVQDEGRVVVTITVNPAGQVISTSINKRTNTVNASLRKAAEEAARKARFNQVDGVNNQTGTITYYFKLK